MKNLLTIVLLLLSMKTSAQGTWSSFNVNADELKGEPGGVYYKYAIDTLGAVTMREGEEWKFRIESYHGTFYGIVHDGSVKRIPAVRILMGLYDVNDKLIEKIDNDIEGDENLGYRSAWVNDEWPYTPGQRTKFKKMISGMWSGNGYVRIVIKRINMPDFDLKITPFNQQK